MAANIYCFFYVYLLSNFIKLILIQFQMVLMLSICQYASMIRHKLYNMVEQHYDNKPIWQHGTTALWRYGTMVIQ